jgi:hypothetical protein
MEEPADGREREGKASNRRELGWAGLILGKLAAQGGSAPECWVIATIRLHAGLSIGRIRASNCNFDAPALQEMPGVDEPRRGMGKRIRSLSLFRL